MTTPAPALTVACSDCGQALHRNGDVWVNDLDTVECAKNVDGHEPTTKPALSRLAAVRRLNGTRNPYIVVLLDGVELGRAGGARAARAEAALVTCWPVRTSTGPGVPGVSGLRKDLAAAMTEAARMETRTSMTTRGRYGRPGVAIPLNRPDWAIAVPVVDEVPAR